MSQHRAPKRRADKHHRPAAKTAPSPSSASSTGRHRAGATQQPSPKAAAGRRGFRPPGLLVVGASALVVAAGGAMSVGSAQVLHSPEQAVGAIRSPLADDAVRTHVDAGQDNLGSHLDRNGRPETISRSAGRLALDKAQQRQLEQAAEQQAAARNEALAELASQAQQRGQQIEENQWVLPVEHYQITATFGSGGSLWSSDHTGLDFAAPYGTPVMSVAQGEVTDVGYAGAYGNRVIITHPDGTETWYCHMDSWAVSPGEEVDPGSTVGYIGMTGNTTGPHLHLEVRPSPNVPVDPYTVLVAHGLDP